MDPKLWKRLDAVTKAFAARKTPDLKQIGRAVENDPELALVSVVAYCLYKMASKNHFVKNRRWPRVVEIILGNLKKGRSAAEQGDEARFTRNLASIVGEIQFIDHELSNYAKDLFEKAKIKQASTAYAAGVSLSQAAALTGADRKELQKYIGITRIHDEQEPLYSIQERLAKMRELLNA